jgi:hypothetical protein
LGQYLNSGKNYSFEGGSCKLNEFSFKSLGLSVWGISLTIIELALVKDTDFDHVSHIFSWNQKIPPLSRRAGE